MVTVASTGHERNVPFSGNWKDAITTRPDGGTYFTSQYWSRMFTTDSRGYLSITSAFWNEARAHFENPLRATAFLNSLNSFARDYAVNQITHNKALWLAEQKGVLAHIGWPGRPTVEIRGIVQIEATPKAKAQVQKIREIADQVMKEEVEKHRKSYELKHLSSPQRFLRGGKLPTIRVEVREFGKNIEVSIDGGRRFSDSSDDSHELYADDRAGVTEAATLVAFARNRIHDRLLARKLGLGVLSILLTQSGAYVPTTVVSEEEAEEVGGEA